MRLFGTALLAVSALAATASADTFAFSFNFPAVSGGYADSGSGTLTATFDSGDQYTVTAITGTTSAYGAITGLLPPGVFPLPFPNDNLLFYPTPPYLDLSGISFTVAGTGDDGLGDVNIYYDSTAPGYTEPNSGVDYGPFTVTRITPTVPEPATVFLVLPAAFALVVVRRRRLSS